MWDNFCSFGEPYQFLLGEGSFCQKGELFPKAPQYDKEFFRI